jgi:hypothetical protein
MEEVGGEVRGEKDSLLPHETLFVAAAAMGLPLRREDAKALFTGAVKETDTGRLGGGFPHSLSMRASLSMMSSKY